MNKVIKFPSLIWHKFVGYWKKGWWHKLVVIFWLVILLVFSTMYAVAQWYIHTESNQQKIGVSFIPSYAEYLGVDPHKTLAELEDIGVKHFRFVSYWSEIEPQQGEYDFSTLDWELASAEKNNATVTLAIGLRQPRWPECHSPDWVDTSQTVSKWQPALEQFMTKVINRYKDSQTLISYQLENEYFNGFGECPDASPQRLVDEYKLAKRLDPKHPVIISRTNTFPGFAVHNPKPDKSAISIYRRVWALPIKRYFQYPAPAWYYAFLAGSTKILTGEDSIIHELQAEPWPPHQQSILETSLKEQNKSFNADILKRRFDYAKGTGLPAVYYWGAEYWYYRWKVLDDKSVWTAAQQEFSGSR